MPSTGTGGSTHLPCPLAPDLSAPTPPPPPGAGAWWLLGHGRLWAVGGAWRAAHWVTTSGLKLGPPRVWTLSHASLQEPNKTAANQHRAPSSAHPASSTVQDALAFVDARLIPTDVSLSTPPPPPSPHPPHTRHKTRANCTHAICVPKPGIQAHSSKSTHPPGVAPVPRWSLKVSDSPDRTDTRSSSGSVPGEWVTPADRCGLPFMLASRPSSGCRGHDPVPAGMGATRNKKTA
jgi:hypothetical protein